MLGTALACLFFVSGVPLDSAKLAEARQHYQKARFEEAVKILREADTAGLAPLARADALFLLAVSELALGNEMLSQKAFIHLYTDAPDFELPPYTAPKVVAASERARRQVLIALDNRVEHGRVIVCGEGLPKRANVKVVFTTPTGEEGGNATYDGPCFGAPVAADATGYYVMVSVDGNVRAVAGSRREWIPLDKSSGPGPRPTEVGGGTPWYKHWLTWTIVGVVAAGGVATGVGVAVANAGRSGPGKVRVNLEVIP